MKDKKLIKRIITEIKFIRNQFTYIRIEFIDNRLSIFPRNHCYKAKPSFSTTLFLYHLNFKRKHHHIQKFKNPSKTQNWYIKKREKWEEGDELLQHVLQLHIGRRGWWYQVQRNSKEDWKRRAFASFLLLLLDSDFGFLPGHLLRLGLLALLPMRNAEDEGCCLEIGFEGWWGNWEKERG